MLVVKKYPNRRLYDTSESRYITLDDLAARIKAGSDVMVQDAASGADLTQATLTQIILESRGGARLLPVPLLLRLIRMGDEALAEFFGRYVSWALELYLQARSGARALMPLNPLATAPFAATDALARLVLGASAWGPSAASSTEPHGTPPFPTPVASEEVATGVRDAREPVNPTSPPSPPPPPPVPAPSAAAAPGGAPPGGITDVADDVARLRREIEALKRAVGGGVGVAAKTPPPRARRERSRSKRG